MKRLLRYRDPLTLCAAVLLPLALSGILVPFRSTFAPTASALVFVAMIVAVAVVGNRTAGILATVSSTLWFDFFLTRPYERLAIADRADVETAVTLFIVGVVVTELAARSRHHHCVAAEEADLIGMLYQFSELVAAGPPDSAVIARAREELIALLGLRDCRFEHGDSRRPRLVMEHDARVFLGGTLWAVEDVGLPGPEIELLVHQRGRAVGRFVLTPTPGLPVPYQRRLVAVALTDQVGTALAPELRSA